MWSIFKLLGNEKISLNNTVWLQSPACTKHKASETQMATGMGDFHRPFMQNNIGSITVPSSKCPKVGGGGGGG